MTPVERVRGLRGVTSLHDERARATNGARLDDFVATVLTSRRRVIDAWEVTAILESLGYSDARVQQEFGFPDTRAAGEYVYAHRREHDAPHEPWSPPDAPPRLTMVVRSAASTMIYAVPWLAVFIAQLLRPDAMQFPSRVASAVALALMFSLVASGGLVQAIVRRGEFYVGLQQVGMAWQVVTALLQIGVALVVAVAAVGMFVGWYFQLFAWPALVLGTDAFIIMSVLWMVCGTFAIRQQQWRVAVAFLAGAVTFAASRSAGADVITAELAAVTIVLGAAGLQMRRVFDACGSATGLPRGVLAPRLSVLAYWIVPYFWYGTVYFAFLFADRVAAGSVAADFSGAPFSVPAQYNLAMDLALFTMLVAASGVEVAGALFARASRDEAVRPVADADGLAAALRKHHLRAVALTLGTFAVTGAVIGEIERRTLSEALTPSAWLTLIAGDVGYACLAVALLNALVLFETRRPWTVVRVFTTALVINLVSGYALSHVLGGFYAVAGLVIGAAYFAVVSTAAVRDSLRNPDYAYAVA